MMRKHGKPSFKFPKKEKQYKAIEEVNFLDKEEEDKREKEKEIKKEEKEKKKEEKEHKKEEKKKEEKEHKKLKWKKKKLGVKTEAAAATGSTGDVKPIFAVPLATSVERSKCHDGIPLPIIVRETIDYIEEFGLTCEGIYRISGVKSKVQALKEAYNKGVHVYLHEYEPNIVASLLKQYLRDLPEPVLTSELMPKFEQASTIKNVKQKVEQFQKLLEELPPPNRCLLSIMIVHMTHVIAKESQNKMSLQNVSIVLSPTMQISHRVLNVFFTYSKILFRDTVIKKYVPPMKPGLGSRWSLELPESPSAIEEELHKQESLLNQLHEDLMKVKDAKKEEQLWEVQRMVTQLKRKLKHAKKTHEQILAAEKRETELQKERMDRQQQNVQEKLQQQKQIIMKHQTPPKKESVDSVPKVPAVEVVQAVPSTKVPAAEVVQAVPSTRVLPDPNVEDVPDVTKKEVQSDEEIIQDKETVTTAAVESSEEKDTTVPAADQLHATPKGQQPQPQPVPKLKTSLRPTQVSDFEGKETTEQPADREQEITEVEGEENAKTETVAEIRTDSEIRTEVTEAIEAEESQERVMEEKDKPQQRYSQLSEEEERLRTYSEMSETSDDRIKFIVGETESESGSHLDLKGDDARSESISIVSSEVAADRIDRGGEETEEEPLVNGFADLSMREKPEPPAVEDTETAHDVVGMFSQKTGEGDVEDEEYHQLLTEHQVLLLEEEELLAIGDELRQKCETERNEIERLHQEIAELQQIRDDLYEEEDSSGSSDDDGQDEEELQLILNQLIKENQELVRKNSNLCEMIHQERQTCLDVKVQIRMIQQKQLEAAGGMEKDLLIFDE